jgi:hypothetical protein
MNYTSNYNLKKPSVSDDANINDLNNNFDVIDGALNEHDTQLNTIGTKAEQNRKSLDTHQKVLSQHGASIAELQNNSGSSSFPTQIKDFVSETGTSNGWKYEKWDSGKMVLRTHYKPGDKVFYSTDTSFKYSSYYITYPLSFGSTPWCVSITPIFKGSDEWGFTSLKASNVSSCSFECYLHDANVNTESYDVEFLIEVVGNYMVG